MMNTIDKVIDRLNEIVDSCKADHSRIGYFAVLYRQVTIRVRDGILKGEFDDNPRMEKLDILFAKRFFEAYDAYKIKGEMSESWLRAFEAAQSGKHLVLQHLFLGINAHINLDLGIAAVETMSGENLAAIQHDFFRINSVLSELVDGVRDNIGRISPVFRLLMRFANGKEEILLNFSIRMARDGAWRFAQEYAAAKDKKECIHLRDQVITGLAEGLIHPGRRLSRLVSLICLSEWRSVPRVIEQLAEISKKQL